MALRGAAMSIIQDVIDRYGAYDAAKEREFILSQQRAPEIKEPVAGAMSYAEQRRIATIVMRAIPRWWTAAALSNETGIGISDLNNALHAMRVVGEVERFYPPMRGRRPPDKPQLYRWVQA